METYPGKNGKTFYKEGLFVGYRHYDAKGIEPLFPFGHGLSYTAFEYANMQVSRGSIGEDEAVDVTLEVRNAGPRAGKEVVQLYVHDLESTLRRPEKELKAFTKVELQPGETKTLRFHLDREAFWYYHPAKGGWGVEPGEFEIRAGHSSQELPLRAHVTVTAATTETGAILPSGTR
jgi:beta-glucosidase